MLSLTQDYIDLIADFCEKKKLNLKETVIVDFNEILGEQISKLIEQPGFSAVICNAKYKNKIIELPSEKIGYFNPDGGWIFPDVSAQSIILLGSYENLGGKRLCSLILNGVKYVNILPALGLSSEQTRSVVFLTYTYLIRRVYSVLYHRLQFFIKIIPSDLQFIKNLGVGSYTKKIIQLTGDIPIDKFQSIPERILLVNNGLAPGGAERQFVNTALALKNAGHDVQIIVLKSGDAYFDFYRHRISSEIPIFNLYQLAYSSCKSNRNDDSAFKTADQIIKKYQNLMPALAWNDITCFVKCFLLLKPSIVHIWQDSTNITAGVAALLLNIEKIILATRNMAPHRFAYYQSYMAPVYRAMLKQKNVVMTNNSQPGAHDYEKWLRLSEGSVPVILNGINFSTSDRESDAAEFRSKFHLHENHHVVGSVFRFWPEKDPQLWISTASLIARAVQNVKFLLVGEGPLQDQILALATKNDIAELLVLPGYLDDPIPAYLSMDVFLLTSKYEGTPNVLIEAQMAGVPAVTTDAGGCRDIIEEDKTGFVLFDRSPEKLAAKTISLIQNREKRIEMSIHAKNRASQKFGIQQMLNTTLDLYFDKQI